MGLPHCHDLHIFVYERAFQRTRLLPNRGLVLKLLCKNELGDSLATTTSIFVYKRASQSMRLLPNLLKYGLLLKLLLKRCRRFAPLPQPPYLGLQTRFLKIYLFIYLFGVLCRFQHCTGHITTGSWKGRGNQYIQFVRVLYCKLSTNGKQLPAYLRPCWGSNPGLRGGRRECYHSATMAPCFLKNSSSTESTEVWASTKTSFKTMQTIRPTTATSVSWFTNMLSKELVFYRIVDWYLKLLFKMKMAIVLFTNLLAIILHYFLLQNGRLVLKTSF